MSYYERCRQENVLRWMRPLLDAGGCTLTHEGTFRLNQKLDIDIPWEFIKKREGTDSCVFLHKILFNIIFPAAFGRSLVPIECQNCWKVVIKPDNFKDFWGLRSVMKRLNRPSKLGIEIRPYVHGNYGCYFWNQGLENGAECFRTVREVVADHIPVIFKRACTEMESACGPSDEWKVYDGQAEFEADMREYIEVPDDRRLQSKTLITDIHCRWVEFAYERGDKWYTLLTGGKPLYPTYKTYNNAAMSLEMGE